jgi:hypothetical protein
MTKNVRFIEAAIDIVIYPEITINRSFAGVKE